MTIAAHEGASRLPGNGRQLFAFLAGILAWKLQLMTIYALVPFACWRDLGLLIHLASLASVLLALGGARVGWGIWKRSGEAADTELGGPVGRSRFLGLTAVALNAFFALVVLGQWIPNLFLSPCDGIS